MKLLEEKKELYSMGYKQTLNRIISAEFVGLQDFYEIHTFSGGKVTLGIDCQVYVDDEWIEMEDILFYEKLYVYDILSDVFRDTYITKIGPDGNHRAFKVTVENNDGIIIDSIIIRFEGDPVAEISDSSPETEIPDPPPETEIPDP